MLHNTSALRKEQARLHRRLRTLPTGPWRGVPLDDVPLPVLRRALGGPGLRDELGRLIQQAIAYRRDVVTRSLLGIGPIAIWKPERRDTGEQMGG